MLELAWRDFFFWPLVRPMGILFYYFATPLAQIFSFAINRFASLGNSNGSTPSSLPYQTIRREFLTLANAVTCYGLFLFFQLGYLIWTWIMNYESAGIFSTASWMLQYNVPDIYLMAFLTLEIFATDMIDGPCARVNDQVTALGTLLDHLRDYLTAVLAFCFLIILAWVGHDTAILILIAGAFGGFLLILAYHIRLMRLFAGKSRFNHQAGHTGLVRRQIRRIRRYALDEYQTRLTGRIQFSAMAFGVEFGLLYYGTHNQTIYVLFIAALAVSMMATSYYLYELWGEYYHKWQEHIHEKSQQIKEKLVDKIRR